MLAFLVAVAADGWSVSRRAVASGALFAIAVGVGVELLQGPLPYRDTQLSDALWDAAGAGLGVLAFSLAGRARAP